MLKRICTKMGDLRKPEWLVAVGMTLIAVWLHLVFVFHAGGLWRDEVNVLSVAGRPSLAGMAKDSFPLLMPLMVRGWSWLGLASGDMGLRWLGALVGLGMMAALWCSAKTTTRLPPLLGLALFALNSTVIYYGDALRAYGLGSLLIILVFAATFAFLQRPSVRRGALLGLIAILSVQTLYQNAVLVAAICAGGWAMCWRRRSWSSAASIFLVALAAATSLVPYVAGLLAGRESAAVVRAGFQWGHAWAKLKAALGCPLMVYSWLWVLLTAATVGGAFLARRPNTEARDVVAVQAAPHQARLFAGVVLGFAIAAFGAFHWIAALPTQPWYYLPLMALAVACFDASRLPLPRKLYIALFALILGTACVAPLLARQRLACRFTNVDLLAHRLETEAAPSDFIVVPSWCCGITFHRYFKGPTPWSTLPPLSDHSTHRYDLVRLQMQDPRAVQPVLDQIERTLRSGKRVWILGQIYIPLPGTPPPPDLPPPPLKSSGWSDGPYSRNWTAKVAHVLSEHSHVELVADCAEDPINPLENLCLFAASGWTSGL